MLTRKFLRLGANVADLAFATLVAAAAFVLLSTSGAAGPERTARGQSAMAARTLAGLLPATHIEDVARGSLLFRADDAAALLLAPTVATDVNITVGGLVARAHVTQKFRNPSDDWVEGIYVFPLPDNAAVDHLTLHIGERIIEGRINEREEARRIYETAKREGKKAGLLEGQRPNIFTTSVANIGPKEEITVTIEYQQTLRYEQGAFRLRFPMVVGPRYIPGKVRIATVSASGWSAPTDQVPDAENITPPVLPDGLGKVEAVRLAVELSPGFALAELESPYHEIDVTERDGAVYQVTLKDGEIPADRDFELVWKPEIGAAPAAGLFSETLEDEPYLLVMVMPPTAEPAEGQARPLPREVIFVIDTSGSMAGASIEQAKAALILALDRLEPGDRFNIVHFNNTAFALFPGARAADRETRALARHLVRGLEAEGGTEMAPAIRLALEGSPPRGYIRQVVFLTDGAVGNERKLFQIIHERLGSGRLFTIGIGSAPNSFFMTKAARVGRGTFTYIGDVGEVGQRMRALFEKLERPVLTDLKVAWPDGLKAEMWPAVLPDLYAGEPVVFTAKVPEARGRITISGQLAGQRWQAALALAGGKVGPGIANLWARDKIEGLMNSLHEGGDASEVRRKVVALGLRHHLVTKYTSLVAVDVTPSRPAGVPLESREVPLHLPKGWEYEKVFGEGLKRSPPTQRDARLMTPATPSLVTTQVRIGSTGGLGMPQGATASPLHLALGAALILLGLLTLALFRRRAW